MSRVVVFPQREDAAAYLAFCALHNPDPTPVAAWYPADVTDAAGAWVVGYLGPGGSWNGGDWPEPAGCAAARAGGTIVDRVAWEEDAAIAA
ncbi:hypothetical protein ACG3SL_16995 [Sphingomonas sp. CJ20]